MGDIKLRKSGTAIYTHHNKYQLGFYQNSHGEKNLGLLMLINVCLFWNPNNSENTKPNLIKLDRELLLFIKMNVFYSPQTRFPQWLVIHKTLAQRCPRRLDYDFTK